jgi:hypothetical protein
MKKYLLTAALAGTTALATSGCVYPSDIVPAGKDSYMISSSTGSVFRSLGTSNLKDANAYCDAQGRHMIIRHTGTTMSGFGNRSNDLLFSCVSDTDPEWQRPNLKSDPTVRIEND